MTVPEGPPPLWRHEHVDSIDSTNALALRRAAEGAAHGLWLSASEQTAGRGRRGRAWSSPRGNLYASVLLRDPASAEATASLALVCAVAVHEAVARVAGVAERLSLKWPNDLLLDGGKLAGLLIEARTDGRGTALACGFGVNCRTAPSDTLYPAATLAADDVAPADLLRALMHAFAAELDLWDRGRNLDAVRERWLARARGLGEPIVVRLPDRELTGTFEALDGEGRLLLRTGGTLQSIAAGDVFAAPALRDHIR